MLLVGLLDRARAPARGLLDLLRTQLVRVGLQRNAELLERLRVLASERGERCGVGGLGCLELRFGVLAVSPETWVSGDPR